MATVHQMQIGYSIIRAKIIREAMDEGLNDDEIIGLFYRHTMYPTEISMVRCLNFIPGYDHYYIGGRIIKYYKAEDGEVIRTEEDYLEIDRSDIDNIKIRLKLDESIEKALKYPEVREAILSVCSLMESDLTVESVKDVFGGEDKIRENMAYITIPSMDEINQVFDSLDIVKGH